MAVRASCHLKVERRSRGSRNFGCKGISEYSSPFSPFTFSLAQLGSNAQAEKTRGLDEALCNNVRLRQDFVASFEREMLIVRKLCERAVEAAAIRKRLPVKRLLIARADDGHYYQKLRYERTTFERWTVPGCGQVKSKDGVGLRGWASAGDIALLTQGLDDGFGERFRNVRRIRLEHTVELYLLCPLSAMPAASGNVGPVA